MHLRLLVYFLLLSLSAEAQINGGNNVYEFLNLAPSARATALGGHHIAVRDDDLALAYTNPGLLNVRNHGQLSFNHSFLFEGISHGYFGYGHYLSGAELMVHGGVQYVNYGDFILTDEFQQELGSFRPRELALTLGASRELYERLSVGANVKYISSQFEAYESTGISADAAAVFHDTTRNFTITLLAKNIGTQLTTYRPGNEEELPFELQLGLSKRLRYLPFRFEVVYRYLNRFNILYDDPNQEEDINLFDPNAVATGPSDFDIFLRHFVFSGEFLFGKRENLRLRFGYNHLRQQELAVTNYRSLGGFSFGFGLKIKQFQLDYGHGIQHFAGNVNHLTLSTRLSEFGIGSRIVR